MIEFGGHQRESLAICIDYICQHGVAPLLPDYTNPQPILQRDLKTITFSATKEESVECLFYTMSFLFDILKHNSTIQLTTSLEYILILFLACCNGLIGASNDQWYNAEMYMKDLETLVLTEKYIKALLILKSFPEQPKQCSKWLHFRLLSCIQSTRGLQSLTMNLLSGSDEKYPLWSRCEAVARIVADRNHTETFYASIVQQLDTLYRVAVRAKDQRFIAVSIACFNQLLRLKREKVTKSIEEIFTAQWQLLAAPEDLLAGLCVLDENEIRSLIELNVVAFRGSQLSSVRTEAVQKCIPLMFQFGTLLKDASEERRQMESLVVHCMANREPHELGSIVEHILIPKNGNTNSGKYYSIHKRIGVKYHFPEVFSVVILAEEDVPKVSDFAFEFVKLLKVSNNNILIFKVFMEILKIFDNVMGEDQNTAPIASQLVSEDDAETFIGRAFMRKSVIISTLAELITHKPFHFQFTEYPSEILLFIQNLLKRKAENLKRSDEQVLVLIFSIFREFIGGQAERYASKVGGIKYLARKIREKCQEMNDLKTQIDFFLNEWNADGKGTVKDQSTKYQMAKELCTNKEPYLRVYGTKELMKLIGSRDTETMANLHSILLSALVYLKDEDSYSFLASIQLLVLLTKHLEGTVIETLIVEFQDTSTYMDYRLKIGEAIVKTVDGLGALAAKYKEMFINCFLKGIEEKCSTDEYRVSCIFNLGQICKFLSFQVHSFFNEMITTLRMVLERDAYVPARRAAAHLLVDLLRGMGNLMDSQEFLLPVYRLLKHICNNDADEKTRVHANAGLECLKEKIKEALTPEEKLAKEIKVLGIETQKEKKLVFPK